MTTTILYVAMFLLLVAISYLWAGGIDNMHRNHPNYKGEDFLGEER